MFSQLARHEVVLSKASELRVALIFLPFPSSAGEHTSATLNRDELMALVFPAWKWAPASLSTLPPTEIVELEKPGKKESSTVLAEPMNVTRLDENHAVMLATIRPVEANRLACGYTCPTPIAAYFFTHTEAGWMLAKRVDDAASTDYGPTDVTVEKWPGHGFVLTYSAGGCWQGACSAELVMLSLRPDRVVPLLKTSLSVDTSRADVIGTRDGGEDVAMSCGDILDTTHALFKELKFERVECQQAEGHWRYEGDRVRFDFSGMSRKDDEHGALAPTDKWKSTAILEWTGSQLKLVDGNLPVFSI